MIEVRYALGALVDENTGEGGTVTEKMAIIIKAWNRFLNGQVIGEEDVKLQYDKDEDNNKHMTECPTTGGIDLGNPKEALHKDEEDEEEKPRPGSTDPLGIGGPVTKDGDFEVPEDEVDENQKLLERQRKAREIMARRASTKARGEARSNPKILDQQTEKARKHDDEDAAARAASSDNGVASPGTPAARAARHSPKDKKATEGPRKGKNRRD